MPTSSGLSYWIHSLPRRLCPIGAAIFSAKSTSSSCAPSTPAPAKIATRSAPLIASATAWIASGDGSREARKGGT